MGNPNVARYPWAAHEKLAAVLGGFVLLTSCTGEEEPPELVPTTITETVTVPTTVTGTETVTQPVPTPECREPKFSREVPPEQIPEFLEDVGSLMRQLDIQLGRLSIAEIKERVETAVEYAKRTDESWAGAAKGGYYVEASAGKRVDGIKVTIGEDNC